MSIKISIKKNLNIKSVKNHVFFTNQDFKVINLSKLPIFKYSSFINKSVSTSNFVNKNILSFNVDASQKIILIKIKNNKSSLDIEKIGAEFYMYLRSNLYLKTNFYEQNISSTFPKNKFFFDQFAQGLQLKSYEFNVYKTDKSKNLTTNLYVFEHKSKKTNQLRKKLN